MTRYSWAVDGTGGAVVCHQSTEEMRRVAPLGIACCLPGVSPRELIELLEESAPDSYRRNGA